MPAPAMAGQVSCATASRTMCTLSPRPRRAAAGARVIIPYLRGYGPTRFLSADTPRSGEQAVLASDLLALLDALAIPKAVGGGYWGGRACCIVSALWTERGSRSSPDICGMVTLQALKTAKALGITTQADRKEDISCHVLRFPTEHLLTVPS